MRELALFLGTLLYAYAEAAVRLLLPARRKAVGGELVLLTGAGRGLGRATAREFARRQSRLVLWDVDTVTGRGSRGARCKREAAGKGGLQRQGPRAAPGHAGSCGAGRRRAALPREMLQQEDFGSLGGGGRSESVPLRDCFQGKGQISPK